MNKTELLEELEDARKELFEMLEDLPDVMLLAPNVMGDWSIKDILAHLTYWEGQMVTMLFQIQRGIDRPSYLELNTRPEEEVNQQAHVMSKDRALEQIWQDWLGVRKQTIRRVSELNERDLTDPRRFSWLNNVPLAQWIADATFLHEEEHAVQIGEWLDQQEEEEDSGPSNNGHGPV